MADKIHGKKKDYPHFDKFYVGSPDYQENFDRIFRKKARNGKKGNKLQEQGGVQKVAGLRSHAQSLQRKDARKNKRKGS